MLPSIYKVKMYGLYIYLDMIELELLLKFGRGMLSIPL